MEHDHKNHSPTSGENAGHAHHDHSMMHHAPGSHGQGTMPHGHEGHASHSGHDHGKMINDFRKRFYITLALTAPVLLLSRMIQEIFHFTLQFPGDQYVLFVLSTFIFVYGGRPFFSGLVQELKKMKPGMMTLVAVAITSAYIYSTAVVFGLMGMDFFWELATLIDVMLLGHWVEMKSVAGASRALELLVKMMPATAHMLDENDQLRDIPVSELTKGNRILIRPGEKIPADALVVKGESAINESMLTGESKPVTKTIGDKLIAGSINGNGSLTAEVQHTGADTYLSKVIQLVKEAQDARSRTQLLADKAALWLTVLALGGGAATLAAWLFSGAEISFAVERMVTVMVISCPHALGLAVPLVVAISTAMAAQRGLLIRNRTAFESARKITTIVFDKTGTLTSGHFGVTRYESLNPSVAKEEILRLAAALETNSEHPIANGIREEAAKSKQELPPVQNFRAITGKGAEGMIAGANIKVVSPGYLAGQQIGIPANVTNDSAETIVYVLINDRLSGWIALADQVRPESADAIRLLHQNGIKTIMLTGDNEHVAQSVSKELGLDGFFAGVLPHQKLEKIREMQQRGEFVAMTGDGVNDAPALAQADVGIAVGSGTDVAAETADIVLVNSNPRDIAALILAGRATYRKIVQNLIWATAYNVITLPLATGFIPGITITPAIGAVFMSLSTIIVAVNAQLLRRSFRNQVAA